MKLGEEKLIFRALKRTLRKRKRFEIAALKTVERLVKSRIHTKGRATDNSSIGKYVSNWKKVRDKAGRQTRYVDLSFKGELIQGYTVGISEGKNVLGFLRDIERLKVEGSESYRKKDIIAPSDAEQKAADKAYKLELDFLLKKELDAVPT